LKPLFVRVNRLIYPSETVVRVGDELVLTGMIEIMEKAGSYFGPEVTLPRDFQFVEENREIILTKKSLIGKELQQIHDEVSVDLRHGVFLTGVKRMGRELPVLLQYDYVTPKLQCDYVTPKPE